jgi:hypothetical protein
MFKDEISKLSPVNKKELSFLFFGCILLMVVSYFWDDAMIVRLGSIPSLFIYSCAKELNINLVDTPKLHYLVIGLIAFFFIAATILAFYKFG